MIRGLRVQECVCRNASKSNLRGYASAVLAASLQILLTSARLTRVLTHCTWEKTKVATSMLASKIFWTVSSFRLRLRVDMVGRCARVEVRGREHRQLRHVFSLSVLFRSPRNRRGTASRIRIVSEQIGSHGCKIGEADKDLVPGISASHNTRRSPFREAWGVPARANRPFQRTRTPGHSSAAPNTP